MSQPQAQERQPTETGEWYAPDGVQSCSLARQAAVSRSALDGKGIPAFGSSQGVAMNIVVTVKQVPDPNTPPNLFTIDYAAKRVLTPTGIPPVMNGYDANAVEEAVRLKEQRGGKVTAVSVGDASVRDTLRRAIAMGATAAVHVEEPAELDSLSTAQTLAAVITRLAPVDLILCGRQASDTDGGQVLFGIAELLGLPAVSPIRKIVQVVEDRVLVVDRITEDGAQRVRVELPALVGVSSEVNQPRYPTLKGVLIAKRAPIPIWQQSDLCQDDPRRHVEARRFYVETRDARTEFIEGESPAAIGARLAEKLREAGLI